MINVMEILLIDGISNFLMLGGLGSSGPVLIDLGYFVAPINRRWVVALEVVGWILGTIVFTLGAIDLF